MDAECRGDVTGAEEVLGKGGGGTLMPKIFGDGAADGVTYLVGENDGN